MALSSTEAEYGAAADDGKIALYLRSILHDLGISQDNATLLYEDNQGALLMANAGQPKKRTRHIDIRHFALQEWVERDLLVLSHIPTANNCADTLTKSNTRIIFHRHHDLRWFLLGRQRTQSELVVVANVSLIMCNVETHRRKAIPSCTGSPVGNVHGAVSGTSCTPSASAFGVAAHTLTRKAAFLRA